MMRMADTVCHNAMLIKLLIAGSFALKGSVIFSVISGSDKHADGAGLSLQSPPAISLLILGSALVSVLLSVREIFSLLLSTPAEQVLQYETLAPEPHTCFSHILYISQMC